MNDFRSAVVDIELAGMVKECVVSHADGYPAIGEFVSADPNSESFVFRKFNTLSARKMLYLQSELIELERQQLELDREAFLSDDHELHSSMRTWEDFGAKDQCHAGVRKRKELADEMDLKLERYRKRTRR